ncbi:ANTAR domain-containing response regulator [Novimethylophilus kurashikiensis]|uniref:ANTAR domain-containing response regulator n=1 Tax=Novimethylophilus kurashikiensis TaxID=1825523 RepID=UPI002795D625|nr:ANTAR domain-containing protein [Novimethylophilus kurashikiensis]
MTTEHHYKIKHNIKVMLVDENQERTVPLTQVLSEAGYQVIAYISDMADLNKEVARLNPDVIIIDIDSPSRDTLEHIAVASRDDPRAIVMFTHDGDTEKIRSATRAGVSAYVVGGISNERLKPIMDAALARFDEYRGLRLQLDVANNKLAERKVIEKAKGILMQRRSVTEDEAYQALRKMAMDRNERLGEVARQVVEAAQLLG